jgi:hypothetical protein
MKGASDAEVNTYVREQFAAMDTDADGKVTLEEFKLHLRRVESGEGLGGENFTDSHVFIDGSAGLLRSLLREDEATLRRRINNSQVPGVSGVLF